MVVTVTLLGLGATRSRAVFVPLDHQNQLLFEIRCMRQVVMHMRIVAAGRERPAALPAQFAAAS